MTLPMEGTARFKAIPAEPKRPRPSSRRLFSMALRRVDDIQLRVCILIVEGAWAIFTWVRMICFPTTNGSHNLLRESESGGATECLKFNNVSRMMCFAGLVSPSLRSSNKRAAVVPSW